MLLTCISDTHNFHEKIILPSTGDVIIHAGDFTEAGTKREAQRFLKWFSSLPFKHKICIAGNHDFYLEKASAAEIEKIIPSNVHYLKDSEIIIEGVKFWGSPYIPFEQNWAFSKSPYEIEKHWNKIPKDVDVLITHTPPKGILDESNQQIEIGCPALKQEIEEKNPKIHVFGHLHENYGKVQFKKTLFINATSLFGNFTYTNLPIQVNIPD